MKTCPHCQATNQDAATFCSQCGHDLTGQGDAGTWTCSGCQAANPMRARFCPHCGGKRPEQGAPEASGGKPKTMFFGSLQEQGQAKLVLVRGGEWEGVSYQLNADHHLAGREDGFLLFADDPYVSPLHCDFYYESGRLMVADQGSLNGVYVRLKKPVVLARDTWFRVGEQLFHFDTPDNWPPIEPLNRRDDDTVLFGSPVQTPPGLGRLEHVMDGGRIGAVSLLERDSYTMGREGCSFCFPTDRFISGKHAKLTRTPQGWVLEDTRSRNGTFIRARGEQELVHGDYLFVGQQLLRVEIIT